MLRNRALEDTNENVCLGYSEHGRLVLCRSCDIPCLYNCYGSTLLFFFGAGMCKSGSWKKARTGKMYDGTR